MNLTKVSEITRTLIAGFILFLIVYFTAYLSWPVIKETYARLVPSREKPVLLYGQITALKLENSVRVNTSGVEYVLSTKDGRIPNITPQLINVYKVAKPQFTLSYGKIAQRKAAVLGFKEEDSTTGLSENVYRYRDAKLARDLQINITANTIDYRVDLTTLTPDIFADPNVSGSDRGEAAKGILSTLGYLSEPLYAAKTTTPRVIFGKLENGRVVETTTQQDYRFAKVDFIRTVFRVPIVGPRFDDSLLQVIYPISPTKDEKLRYLRINAFEWTPNTKEYGRYPALPVQEAWKKVANNEGMIAKALLRNASQFEEQEQVTLSKIFVQNVSIGYLDSYTYQEYLQPIYIFDGTFLTPDNQAGNIVIYYPALDPKNTKP